MMLIFSSFHFSTSRQSLACLIWGFPGLTVKEKEKGTDVTLCHPLTCNNKTHVYITGAVAGGGLAIILTFSSRVSLGKGTVEGETLGPQGQGLWLLQQKGESLRVKKKRM